MCIFIDPGFPGLRAPRAKRKIAGAAVILRSDDIYTTRDTLIAPLPGTRMLPCAI